MTPVPRQGEGIRSIWKAASSERSKQYTLLKLETTTTTAILYFVYIYRLIETEHTAAAPARPHYKYAQTEKKKNQYQNEPQLDSACLGTEGVCCLLCVRLDRSLGPSCSILSGHTYQAGAFLEGWGGVLGDGVRGPAGRPFCEI